jgi:hypothetical protein
MPSSSYGIHVSIALAQIACPAAGRLRRLADKLAAPTHREAAL